MDKLSVVKRKFVDYIDNIIEYNKVSHAYLIEIDDENDLIYINNFLKMILCDKKYNDVLCSDNKICHLVDEKEYPDITYISTDLKSIKKSTMIDLQKEFNNKSLFGKQKIYVIEEAEKLNDSSANTILKFLEEPEDNIIAFLITKNRYHVIETILSRCQILSLKENNDSGVLNNEILDFLDYILRPEDFFINYNDVIKNKYSDKNLLKDILIEVEKIIVDYLNGCNKDSDVNSLFVNYKSSDLIRIISILEEEIPKLRFNVNYKLWVDSLFARIIGG